MFFFLPVAQRFLYHLSRGLADLMTISEGAPSLPLTETTQEGRHIHTMPGTRTRAQVCSSDNHHTYGRHQLNVAGNKFR